MKLLIVNYLFLRFYFTDCLLQLTIYIIVIDQSIFFLFCFPLNAFVSRLLFIISSPFNPGVPFCRYVHCFCIVSPVSVSPSILFPPELSLMRHNGVCSFIVVLHTLFHSLLFPTFGYIILLVGGHFKLAYQRHNSKLVLIVKILIYYSTRQSILQMESCISSTGLRIYVQQYITIILETKSTK